MKRPLLIALIVSYLKIEQGIPSWFEISKDAVLLLVDFYVF